MVARFTFSGIDTDFAAEMPLSRGVSPSICTAFIAPQQAILDLPPGTLTISDGQTEVSFSGCLVEQANSRMRWDGTHWRWAIHIVDRRRGWRNATVTGEFNSRLSDGEIVTATKKSARELMQLCLDACGEAADVSAAPNNVYPYVRWGAERADVALAKLLDYTACEVVPTLSDTFKIVRLGVGEDLITPHQVHYHLRHIPRTTPSRLEIIGAPTIYQNKLLLQVIAEDTDDSQKTLQTVSYALGNWGYENPITFPGVGSVSALAQRKALESVYRRYRVQEQASGGLNVPGSNTGVESISQYFPLFEPLVEAALDLEQNPWVRLAFVEGFFWQICDACDSQDDFTAYTGQFRFQGDRGEVYFPAPVFGMQNGLVTEPDLYVTCAHWLRAVDGQLDRVRFSRQLEGEGPTETLLRVELFEAKRATYDENIQTGIVVTPSGLEAEAQAYLDLFEGKYADPVAGEGHYWGLVAQELDGRIAQIYWRCGAEILPRTQISLNAELCPFTTPRKDRRRRELSGVT